MFKGLCRLTGVVALICSTFSHVLRADSDTQVYTGNLGKMPIVLEVNLNSGEGRYFYQKYRQDLTLSGTREGELLVMSEGGDEDEHRPIFRLQLKPQGWSGEWTNAKGKVLKVELQPARLAPLTGDTLPYLTQLHDKLPYEFLRLQGLKLSKGQTENFMGYTLQWWSEPLSGVQLFEVVSGYSVQVRQRINQRLMARFWQGVGDMLGCTVDGRPGSYSQTSQPVFMSQSVMSAFTSTDFYCGGLHPNQDNETLNFDAKTGRVLTLDDVLWVGQGKPAHFEEGTDEYSSQPYPTYSEYRTKELAPWLVAQLLKRYPKEMTIKPAIEEGDCIYNDDQPWGYPLWHFTENGLKLEPSFIHAAAVCRDTAWSVLPYSLVKQHPGGVALQLP